MNRVVLMGRLTRDPEVRQSQAAESVTIARYTLAVDRRRGKGEEQSADFISCVAFGKAGEFAQKYLHKGSKICVSGRIQTGSYTRQDGSKAYTTDVVVDGQEFAESRQDAGRNAMDDQMAAQYGGQGSAQAAGSGQAQGQREQSSEARQQDTGGGSWQQGALDGFMNIPEGIDEELPFN